MIIPIILSINNLYVKQLSTILLSLNQYANSEDIYEVNVIHSDLSETNIQILEKMVNNFGSKILIFFHKIDLKKECLNLEKFMSRRDNYTYISIETYFRFFIPDLLKQYEKVLYIDADILIREDLSILYKTDISSYSIAAVKDPIIQSLLTDDEITTESRPELSFQEYLSKKLNINDSTYFNAGIILFNLEKIRQDNQVEKLWDFVERESPLEFQDQDALNSIFHNSVLYLDYKWNLLKDVYIFESKLPNIIKKDVLKAYKNPSIFHYVGSNKPWIKKNADYNYPFIKEWWDLYKQTPFFQQQDMEVFNYILSKKSIKKRKNYERLQYYFIFRIFKFDILTFYKQDNRLRLRILNFLRFHYTFK